MIDERRIASIREELKGELQRAERHVTACVTPLMRQRAVKQRNALNVAFKALERFKMI